MSDRDQNVAKQMLAAVQVDKAVRLRAAGAHWREVADQCGYSSPAAALKAVGAAMQAATLRAEQTADDMRAETQLRLESLLGDALGMIAAETFYGDKGQELDDRPHRLKAVETARKIVADLTKLNGLDKPAETAPEDVPTIRVVGVDPSEVV
jgi:hypothetical protein